MMEIIQSSIHHKTDCRLYILTLLNEFLMLQSVISLCCVCCNLMYGRVNILFIYFYIFFLTFASFKSWDQITGPGTIHQMVYCFAQEPSNSQP